MNILGGYIGVNGCRDTGSPSLSTAQGFLQSEQRLLTLLATSYSKTASAIGHQRHNSTPFVKFTSDCADRYWETGMWPTTCCGLSIGELPPWAANR